MKGEVNGIEHSKESRFAFSAYRHFGADTDAIAVLFRRRVHEVIS